MQDNKLNTQEMMSSHIVHIQDTCMDPDLSSTNNFVETVVDVINQVKWNKTIFILQFNKLSCSPPTLSRPQKTMRCNLWCISQPEEGAVLNAHSPWGKSSPVTKSDFLWIFNCLPSSSLIRLFTILFLWSWKFVQKFNMLLIESTNSETSY